MAAAHSVDPALWLAILDELEHRRVRRGCDPGRMQHLLARACALAGSLPVGRIRRLASLLAAPMTGALGMYYVANRPFCGGLA
jgi:hypothetical protein